jgi:hypothetical protein
MQHLPRQQAPEHRAWWGVIKLGTVIGAAVLAGCNGPSRSIAPSSQSPSAANSRARYLCTASLVPGGTPSTASVTCVPAGSSGSARRAGDASTADVVLNSQGINVKIILSNFAYSNSTHIFSMSAAVENLLSQPIGTTDNSTTTPAGVRVYFTYGPVPNDGIGTVSIISPDGDTTFQGHADPYFKYTPFIKPQATSAAKTWSFQLSANAIGFNFAVEVDAAVPSQSSVLRWMTLRQGVTPQALNAAWRNTASDQWAVGDSNTVLHYNGTLWAAQATGLSTGNMYNGVWGTSATDVWVVGNSGVAAHYNGSAWSLSSTNTTANLSGIWGNATTLYYATAPAGKVYAYNGSTWTKVSFGFNTNTNLHAVWGADASHVWVVGDKGLILFYNGTSWSQPASATTQALYAVWGTSATNVYAVGNAGAIIHFDGTSWSAQTSNISTALSGVGGTGASDVWAVGAPGVTLHYNGTSWSTVSPVVGLSISAIASGTSGPVWAVGSSGALLSLSATGPQVTLSNQSGVQLLGVWASSASDVWAAAPGTILHYDGTNWTSAYVSNGDPMSGVWGTGPTNVYVVGQKGTIANYNGTAWTTSVVNATGFNGIFGTSASNIFAVGNGGLVEQFNGTSWSVATHTGTGNLTSVWGTGSPATFYAVASDGTAYRSVNGGPWSTISFSPANAAALNGVYGTSTSDLWATGNSGAAYINTGAGFTTPSPANGLATNFYDVWNTSASDVYLVGAGGTVQYFNGTVWFAMSTPVATALRSIYGTAAQNVYVAGDNGVVLWGTGP